MFHLVSKLFLFTTQHIFSVFVNRENIQSTIMQTLKKIVSQITNEQILRVSIMIEPNNDLRQKYNSIFRFSNDFEELQFGCYHRYQQHQKKRSNKKDIHSNQKYSKSTQLDVKKDIHSNQKYSKSLQLGVPPLYQIKPCVSEIHTSLT